MSWVEKSLITVLVVISVSLYCISCSGSASELHESDNAAVYDCTPAFKLVTSEPLKNNIGHWIVEVEAALIGCQEQLVQLQQQELLRVATILQQPGEWTKVLLPIRPQDQLREHRKEIVDILNRDLGFNAIYDIHFFYISTSEAI